MKVLIVSQYYPPEPVSKPAVLARGLVERGHSVKVLTGYPNYPSGQIYKGYSQRWRVQETDHGVDVRRVPLIPSHSSSAFGRAFNYLSFAATSSSAVALGRSADVVYVYATQMTPAVGPRLWRSLGGAPFVLHIQDLWPESITGSSMVPSNLGGRFITSMMNPWLAGMYSQAAAVIGIAPSMQRMLVERGAPAERTHMVYNFADEDGWELGIDSPFDVSGTRRVTNVLYAGNIGTLQNLEVAVRAAAYLADVGLRLTFIGDGGDLVRVRQVAEDIGAGNVTFLPRVPPDQISQAYGNAHFALVSLRDLNIFAGTIPSKFQAALVHGVPVIASVPGDVRSIVDKNRIGFSAEPDSFDSLVTAMRSAAALQEEDRIAMARRARQTYVEQFSQRVSITRIESILLEVVQADPRRA